MPVDSPTKRLSTVQMDGWPLKYLQHVEGLVAFGDTKAGLLLTADAILLTGLGVGAERLELSGLSALFAVVAAFALVMGLCAVLVAIAPSARHFAISRKVLGAKPVSGYWFQFGAVKHFKDGETFATAILAQSDDILERDLLESIWGKSGWIAWKFGWLLVGVLFTLCAVGIATAAGVVKLLSDSVLGGDSGPTVE